MPKAAKAGMRFTVLGSLFFEQLFPEFHLHSLRFLFFKRLTCIRSTRSPRTVRACCTLASAFVNVFHMEVPGSFAASSPKASG